MTTWPALPLEEWRDTCDTLHMWTQIVGKVRLSLTPTVNHWWNVPLYVSARGLTTSEIPYDGRWFDMEFDFVDHVLRIRVSDGTVKTVKLVPRSVADFYRETMATLRSIGIEVTIREIPNEFEDAIPFGEDERHHAYDRTYVERFWQILALTERVFASFRAKFIGKSSPVHFFWGSFDLAVTRFSGRRAPLAPDADSITREAYSHEVSSVGWWPGDARLAQPAYYSYAAPEPAGFPDAKGLPPGTYYHDDLSGFYLHYETVRRAADPAKLLTAFAQSTYDAAADLGKWDRAALER